MGREARRNKSSETAKACGYKKPTRRSPRELIDAAIVKSPIGQMAAIVSPRTGRRRSVAEQLGKMMRT